MCVFGGAPFFVENILLLLIYKRKRTESTNYSNSLNRELRDYYVASYINFSLPN